MTKHVHQKCSCENVSGPTVCIVNEISICENCCLSRCLDLQFYDVEVLSRVLKFLPLELVNAVSCAVRL